MAEKSRCLTTIPPVVRVQPDPAVHVIKVKPDGTSLQTVNLTNRIGQPLISELQIQRRTSQLARQIAIDYQNREMVVIAVLKGAFVFTADLLRRLNKLGAEPFIDFIRASSYGAGTTTSGELKIGMDVTSPLKNNHVLLVDDIVDTGLTMTRLCDHMTGKGAASVKCCALLDKPSRREVKFVPDYVGFEIPDLFVVGYGLDFNEKYRYLPYITVLANNKSK